MKKVKKVEEIFKDWDETDFFKLATFGILDTKEKSKILAWEAIKYIAFANITNKDHKEFTRTAIYYLLQIIDDGKLADKFVVAK